jgi:hypothetical protein
MGIVDLIRLAFSGDDEIFIPLDNEYQCDMEEGKCIWEMKQQQYCEVDNSNMERMKEMVDNGLPEKPEGEAPTFELNDGREQ